MPNRNAIRLVKLRKAALTNYSAITHLYDKYAASKRGVVVEKADSDAVNILQEAILQISNEIYNTEKVKNDQ